CSRRFPSLFFALMQRPISRNQARRYFVPILEHLFNLTANDPTREPSSEKTERQGVFYPIFKCARGRAIRLESVCMLPVPEWAGHLDVAEKAALFVVQM